LLIEIEKLKAKLQKNGERGIALDIDETLSWTVAWWVEQLQEKFGNPENLTVEELIAKYRYTQNVPYWQTKEALQWMHDHREASEVQEELPLIAGADEYVEKLNEIIPITAYITTRPDSVNVGTYRWLEKHGFPKAPVIARPRYVDHSLGNMWKADVLQYLQDDVLGIVDDNPGLADNLHKDYPGTLFLYDNDSHRRQDEIDIIPCKDWGSVLIAVARRFG
jgi:hypothetical protein